ncbi:V-type ATP synthase subunit F [Thermoanaerobacterium sp. RBIITD]|uniref:V-type ATP synthase subunit F n=1 Tax=Thermoanaerobacterium sp. RBIITD TaxID=1550240 RepID=UPI000BB9116A|nr:V-type ATP synthase subunit F [Thermoanaerobacterium sp. RBIITD]SNX53439.1 V/A-type H+-transporting ATPase subunit F [Thermoanaerobacterium sp. RBIITD]
MKVYLLSDNTDTLTGMRLAGIEGIVLHERDEVLKELKRLISDKNIGIILITELLSSKIQDVIKEIRLKRTVPIIVEIPDRHGSRMPQDFITRYIRESIGIKM